MSMLFIMGLSHSMLSYRNWETSQCSLVIPMLPPSYVFLFKSLHLSSGLKLNPACFLFLYQDFACHLS